MHDVQALVAQVQLQQVGDMNIVLHQKDASGLVHRTSPVAARRLRATPFYGNPPLSRITNCLTLREDFAIRAVLHCSHFDQLCNQEGMMATRRQFLFTGVAGAAALACGLWARAGTKSAAPAGIFEVTHTDAEWRKLLTPAQYRILREDGTERPFSSPLNNEHRAGTFSCAGCHLALFSSRTKFNSHTGWPSFWAPLPNAVATRTDTTFGMARTEVHCRRCGGHLGHVFHDGPKPTGLRYCMDGLALTFTPASA
jgi:peptide-methionine (R)-S-oxide reductase